MHRLIRCTAPALTLCIPALSLFSQAMYPGTEGLTAQQQALLTDARTDIAADHWDLALAKLQTLHSVARDNVVLTKFLAEGEINTGQSTDALALMRPLLASNPDDVQALAISAHAYAQGRQATQRDATLAQLQKLHDGGFTKLAQLIVEKDPILNGGSVSIFYFLEPFSRFHITLMARVYDNTGKQLSRITLESGDFDQPSFVKEHPSEAAKGERRYSMDGYTSPTPTTQTHATYGFFDGRPSYDTFRDRALAIAKGERSPASTTTGIPTPAPTPKQ